MPGEIPGDIAIEKAENTVQDDVEAKNTSETKKTIPPMLNVEKVDVAAVGEVFLNGYQWKTVFSEIPSSCVRLRSLQEVSEA